MMGEFQFGIENEENTMLATSVYTHPSTREILLWVRVGRSVFEVHNEKLLDELIDILQYTKQEIAQLKGENND